MTTSTAENSKPLNLPDAKFVSTTAKWKGTLLDCRDLFDGYALNDPVLASTPLIECDWATLFAYMHRRFGMPHVGADDYKDLSGKWMLTTPDSAVFLLVNPSLSGPGFSFTPCILRPDDAPKYAHTASDMELPAQRVEEIKQAYKAVLLDLLRPVCVRDHHINALGELSDSDLDIALLEWDEKNNCDLYEVRFHPSSGFSMPTGLFGGENWVTLCTMIQHHGDGDTAAGLDNVLQILQEEVFADASDESWQVQRLMLLFSGASRQKILAGLRLDEKLISRFNRELKALYDTSHPDYSFVCEMTDDAVNDATQLLEQLGFGGCDVKKSVKKLRKDQAVSEGWADLVAVTESKFPSHAALPKDPYALGNELHLRLKETFDGIGRSDLSDWVARTQARPEGQRALADIAYHIAATVKDDNANGNLSDD
jgi:hypothetical protein